jgi:hypothetical protein
VSGHKPGLLPGHCHHPFFPFNSFRPSMKALSPLVKVGFIFLQGKVQFVDSDQLIFYGDDLGPNQGLFGSALGQVGASARSSATFPQLPLPSRRQAVVLTCLLLPFTTQLFFPEVRRDPFRCLSSFCVNAMISPSAGGGLASTLCIISTPGWRDR